MSAGKYPTGELRVRWKLGDEGNEHPHKGIWGLTKLPPTVEIRVHPDEEISTIVLDNHDRITYVLIIKNKTEGNKQMLVFHKDNNKFGSLEVAVSDTTGFTYEVHNKWDLPRGSGYAVFIKDCATGKSLTGNKAAFYSNNLTDEDAKDFCNGHNNMMNKE